MSDIDNPEVVADDAGAGFEEFQAAEAEVVDAEVVAEPVVEAAPVTEAVVEEPVVPSVPAAAPAADVLSDVGAAATAGAASAIDSIKNVVSGGVGTGAASNALDDAAAFIGPNADYYIPKFQEMDAKNSIISWNWAAFFGQVFWMLYRKMYLYAVVILIAEFILSSFLFGIPALVSAVLFGLFGNWLYKRKVEEELAAAAHLEPAARKAQLAERGGITWVPVIIAAALVLIGILVTCAATGCAALASLGDLSSY